MQSPPDAPTSGLSRRAAFTLAMGSLATFASTDLALRGALWPKPRLSWNELSQPSQPSQASAQVPMIAVPRRVSQPSRHGALALADWQTFKRRFITGDGRVCDNGNGGISHSEGQGWGLLLSVAFDDMANFDLMLDWTRRNLQCRSDALHAWRYVPQSPVPVSDHNNASDGDLFIAAALLRGAWRWQRQDLSQAARDLTSDILRKLVRQVGGRTVLLPGAVGFEQTHTVTINPSYYILPVFDELAALVPSPSWDALRADGVEVLQDGRFGPWRLPPDWLQVDRSTGKLRPDTERPARFSYDAIRVPLWLAWAAGTGSSADLAAPLRDFATYWHRYQPSAPAWVDVATNQMAPYPAPAGMVAIGRVATAIAGTGAVHAAGNGVVKSTKPNENALRQEGLPVLSASIDYYSAALTLVARCVLQESCDSQPEIV